MRSNNDKLHLDFIRRNRRPHLESLPDNVRKTKKERKKRSDAKHDVKIPLTERQLQVFRIMAFHHNMSPTTYAAYLIQKGMEYNMEFKEREYRNLRTTVHVKLNRKQYEQLFTFAVKWNCSQRQAAHRILLGMMSFLKGDISLHESL